MVPGMLYSRRLHPIYDAESYMEEHELLAAAARDGNLDKSKWPEILETLLPQLDHIIYNEFQTPTIPFSEPAAHRATATDDGEIPRSIPGDGAALPVDSSPSRGAGIASSGSQAVIPDSQPSNLSTPQSTLPPQLLSLYTNIKTGLTKSFRNAPPFTIQRLAELCLQPSVHYRTLPSYLRALDRVVSVASSVDSFPLPPLSTVQRDSNNGNSVLASSAGRTPAEDFNGAALTRIPWLRDTASMMMSSERPLASDLRTESTSVIDGPNGAGSIETVTVSVNGFSSAGRGDSNNRQEAGAPVNSTADQRTLAGSHDTSTRSNPNDEAEDDRVHARGPEEIGIKDMGPQQPERAGHVFDAEAAIGRPGEAEQVLPSNDIIPGLAKDEDSDKHLPDTNLDDERDSNPSE